MKISLKIFSVFIALICSLSLLSCSKSNSTEPDMVTDYSIKEHWLALPANITKEVDVFYAYPTAWYKEDPSEPDFCAGEIICLKVERHGWCTSVWPDRRPLPF